MISFRGILNHNIKNDKNIFVHFGRCTLDHFAAEKNPTNTPNFIIEIFNTVFGNCLVLQSYWNL